MHLSRHTFLYMSCTLAHEKSLSLPLKPIPFLLKRLPHHLLQHFTTPQAPSHHTAHYTTKPHHTLLHHHHATPQHHHSTTTAPPQHHQSTTTAHHTAVSDDLVKVCFHVIVFIDHLGCVVVDVFLEVVPAEGTSRHQAFELRPLAYVALQEALGRYLALLRRLEWWLVVEGES